MATLEQCREALEQLAGRLAGADESMRARTAFDRSISVTLPDLGVVFTGRLHDGRMEDLTTEPAPKAQIRLTMASDDLIALTDGSLALPGAWASGRVKVDASILDLMKLRSLL